jgi:hypothetical protein
VKEAGTTIDGGRLAVYARQYTRVYSHFELVLTGGQGAAPLAATGTDLNMHGHRRVGYTAGTGSPAVGDVLRLTDTNGDLRAIVTNVLTSPNRFEYFLIGDLTDFSNGQTAYIISSGNTFTIATGVSAFEDIYGATSNGGGGQGAISVTFGHAAADIDDDSTDENYAVTVNCNSNPLSAVYERLQYLVKRGSGDQGANWLPDMDAGNEDGLFYRAAGDIYAVLDAEGGTGLTEGQVVEGSLSGATGVVVAYNYSGGGYVVLTQVKGTFQDNDVLDAPTPTGNSATIAGTPAAFADSAATPFGQLAGTSFFGARGVLLTNVPAADANNYTLFDVTNTLREPPATVPVEFSGVAVGDRLLIAEVNTGGTNDIKKNQNGVGAAGAAAGATTIPLDSTPPNDTPASETIRVWDVSAEDEYRFRVDSWTGTTVTLATGDSGQVDAGSNGLNDRVIDAGQNFLTTVKIGDIVYSSTTGAWARVTSIESDTEFRHTPLSSGTWTTGDNYATNVVPVALVDADTVYFPYMDRVATVTTESINIKYVSPRNVVARCRWASGADPIYPFEQTGISIGATGLPVAAIRTDDDINEST